MRSFCVVNGTRDRRSASGTGGDRLCPRAFVARAGRVSAIVALLEQFLTRAFPVSRCMQPCSPVVAFSSRFLRPNFAPPPPWWLNTRIASPRVSALSSLLLLRDSTTMSSESASAGSSTAVSFNLDLPGLRIAESNHAAFVALSHCLGLYLIYARAPPKLQSKTFSVNLVYHHVLNALRKVLEDANENVTAIEKAIAEWKQCLAESETEKSLEGDQFASIQQCHWPPVDVVLSSVLEAVAKKYHVEASDYVQFCLCCACVPSVTAKKLADEGGKLESSKIIDFMAKLGANAGPALTPTQHAALAGGASSRSQASCTRSSRMPRRNSVAWTSLAR